MTVTRLHVHMMRICQRIKATMAELDQQRCLCSLPQAPPCPDPGPWPPLTISSAPLMTPASMLL